jgi:manganese/zinc/iron transport system ATP- binding protein
MSLNLPLSFSDLTVTYGGLTALAGISATVSPGQVVGVIGPNGGGKSTLLKTIAGVVRPRTGQLRYGERALDRRATRIAYVPQADEVNWDFPLNARDVALMGTYPSVGWLRRPGRAERRRVDDALARLGLGDDAERHISQFSGGQQQRIFLARALVQSPQIVLLDEPLTGVDVANRAVLHAMLREWAGAGCTVLMATHDLDDVRATCDAVLCLNRRLVAYGPTAATFTPGTLRAAFGGQVAVFN